MFLHLRRRCARSVEDDKVETHAVRRGQASRDDLASNLSRLVRHPWRHETRHPTLSLPPRRLLHQVPPPLQSPLRRCPVRGRYALPSSRAQAQRERYPLFNHRLRHGLADLQRSPPSPQLLRPRLELRSHHRSRPRLSRELPELLSHGLHVLIITVLHRRRTLPCARRCVCLFID